MPKRLRENQKEQRRQRLVNLALAGEPGDHDQCLQEARAILRDTEALQDLGHFFKDEAYPPWIVAAERGFASMVEVYLHHLRNSRWDQQTITDLLDREDPSGDTVLCAAARCETGSDILASLLDAGATPTERALLEAVQKGTRLSIELLLEAGATPTERALLGAVQKRTSMWVELLLEAGATPTERALMEAVQIGAYLSVDLLLRSGLIPTKEMCQIALQRRDVDTLGALTRHGAPLYETLTVTDIFRGREWSILRCFVDADPSVLDAVRRRILRSGALDHDVAGIQLSVWWMSYSRPHAVRVLLDFGADVNATDTHGETLLVRAIHYPKVVSVLLDAGASPNAKTRRGGTVLIDAVLIDAVLIDAAVSYKTGIVVERLLEAGADVNAEGVGGATALHYAAASKWPRPGVFKILLDAGADPALKSSSGHTAMEILLDREKKSPCDERRVCILVLERYNVAIRERYTVLPLVYWNKCPSNFFRSLAETGEETANALYGRIADCLALAY